MDPKNRLQLSKMIKEYKSEETTDKIRELRHSGYIRTDVGVIQRLKQRYPRIYKSDISKFKQIAINRANFLFNNYTNLFNRIIKGELDLNILWQFLEVLEQIEDGTIDQHDGSYQVGLLLKRMYIDSALQREEKEKQKKSNKKSKYKKSVRSINWNEFKKMNEV